jgi:protein PhnA
MKLEEFLTQRSGGACELCKGTSSLKGNDPDSHILLCDTCLTQVERKAELNSNHWKCLVEAMWSEIPAVQVVSWRMLNRLRNESWAAENLEMLYLPDEILAWAKATGDHENDAAVDLHRDCNGQILQQGDTVILTKSLDVKGSTLNAKMGTVVKNIRLVEENTAQIEGRIEGQVIVILTKYVRRQSN